MNPDFDVAIIGGGPGGTTVGSLLKKYNPNLKVLILERETFPRDHVGESQLPLIGKILNEMGAWEKVEAADFPIKIGATYRWGRKDEFWDFEFLPNGEFENASRPGTFTGQRVHTAFQVDRSIYDKILLDHAGELGCTIRQATPVREVLRNGDTVEGLVLGDGSTVTARYYVDASGHSGILRRAMGIHVDYPSNLQNIAIWNYWGNAEWAVSLGVGGTRIQVLAQKVGWLWFIPLGANRTSIGLVIPVKYFKDRGLSANDLYHEAMRSDAVMSILLKNATCEPNLHTTKDWSFVADRLTGENWFLAGESAGFADPILSAGMSLTHTGAREIAYAILAVDKGEYDPAWLRNQYCVSHRQHIRQHIRFADYWYTANGVYSELKAHAQSIALDAGINMTPEEAWSWLGQGGFIDPNGSTDIGFFGSLAVKELISSFTGQEKYYAIAGKTHFRLDLEGVVEDGVAETTNGMLIRHPAYRRNGKILPLVKQFKWLVDVLNQERSFTEIKNITKRQAAANSMSKTHYNYFWSQNVKCLEALVTFGWVLARTEPGAEACPSFEADLATMIHANRDVSRLVSGE